jgi:hypothetical protein
MTQELASCLSLFGPFKEPCRMMMMTVNVLAIGRHKSWLRIRCFRAMHQADIRTLTGGHVEISKKSFVKCLRIWFNQDFEGVSILVQALKPHSLAHSLIHVLKTFFPS